MQSGHLLMVLGLLANDAHTFADDGSLGCGLLQGGDLGLIRPADHGDLLGELCGLKLGKTTSAPSFWPVVPDVSEVVMQRMLSISASLGTLCIVARVEKGNETGEKCLWHLALTGSKQDDGHKPMVNTLLPVEKLRCVGTGCHLTAPRQFVLSRLGCFCPDSGRHAELGAPSSEIAVTAMPIPKEAASNLEPVKTLPAK